MADGEQESGGGMTDAEAAAFREAVGRGLANLAAMVRRCIDREVWVRALGRPPAVEGEGVKG